MTIKDSLVSHYSNIKIKVREILNPFLGRWRLRELNNTFTIISNNCWAGHVYRYYNLPYDTPTVGLYIFSEDYLKFVNNLRHYVDTELKFIDYTDSKYKDEIIKRQQQNLIIGLLDDVEIMFLHYKSRDEAAMKWQIRKERIHWDSLYFKMSEQNLCSETLIRKFDELPTEKKFIFVTKNYDDIKS